VLAAFLGPQEPDAFWRQVDANLRAGRVRMVFVADRIPPELRRIVEFLNEQMRPAECSPSRQNSLWHRMGFALWSLAFLATPNVHKR
jgi:hypothetical protein